MTFPNYMNRFLVYALQFLVTTITNAKDGGTEKTMMEQDRRTEVSEMMIETATDIMIEVVTTEMGTRVVVMVFVVTMMIAEIFHEVIIKRMKGWIQKVSTVESQKSDIHATGPYLIIEICRITGF